VYTIKFPLFVLPWHGKIWGTQQKAVLGSAQTLGYALGKIPAIKVLSELRPQNR